MIFTAIISVIRNNDYNKKNTFALNLQSESESQGRGGIDEFDVSGPENDLAEDDFWN